MVVLKLSLFCLSKSAILPTYNDEGSNSSSTSFEDIKAFVSSALMLGLNFPVQFSKSSEHRIKSSGLYLDPCRIPNHNSEFDKAEPLRKQIG